MERRGEAKQAAGATSRVLSTGPEDPQGVQSGDQELRGASAATWGAWEAHRPPTRPPRTQQEARDEDGVWEASPKPGARKVPVVGGLAVADGRQAGTRFLF